MNFRRSAAVKPNAGRQLTDHFQPRTGREFIAWRRQPQESRPEQRRPRASSVAKASGSPDFELSLRVHGKYRHGDSPSGGQAKEQKAPGLEVLIPEVLAGIEK